MDPSLLRNGKKHFYYSTVYVTISNVELYSLHYCFVFCEVKPRHRESSVSTAAASQMYHLWKWRFVVAVANNYSWYHILASLWSDYRRNLSTSVPAMKVWSPLIWNHLTGQLEGGVSSLEHLSTTLVNEDCRGRKRAHGRCGASLCIFCNHVNIGLLSLRMAEQSNEEELFPSTRISPHAVNCGLWNPSCCREAIMRT